MWDLPGLGIEPMSPALAGGFFTTEPLGKSLKYPNYSWSLDCPREPVSFLLSDCEAAAVLPMGESRWGRARRPGESRWGRARRPRAPGLPQALQGLARARKGLTGGLQSWTRPRPGRSPSPWSSHADPVRLPPQLPRICRSGAPCAPESQLRPDSRGCAWSSSG